jgi:hypothetical protein
MGPFQFETYHNPYVQSISSLMMAPAQAQAQAATTIGEAQARAALQQGQAWSGALNNIGQTVAALPQQIARVKQEGTINQLNELKLKEQQSAIADHDKFKSILKDTPQIQEGGMYLWDLPTLGQRSVAAGIDPAPYLAEFGKVNDAFRSEASARQATVQTAAQALAKAPDPDLALNFIDMASRNKTIDGQTAEHLKGMIDAADTPQAKAAVVQKIAITYAGQQKPLILAGAQRPGGAPQTAIDPLTNQVIATGASAGPAQPTPSSIAMDAAGGDPVEANKLMHQPPPVNPETVRHNQATEEIAKMNVGREQAAQAETARHNKVTEAALNPMGALLGGAGQKGATDKPPNVTGDEFLKQLPPDIGTQVKALAEGRMAFPSSFALKTPYWQQMLQAVSQYDPSFDAINYNTRASTRKAFSSGKQSQDVNALNTVISHISKLSDAAETLNNTNSPDYNAVKNWFSQHFGSATVTNFKTIQKAVADEVTRVWRQTGGSVEDIAAARQNLDAANSPEQLRGAIAEYGELLGGKILSMQEQYQQGMGKSVDANATLIRPDTKQTLEKIAGRVTGTEQPKQQTKSLSVDALNKLATTYGMTYDEAKKRAESQGYTIIR